MLLFAVLAAGCASTAGPPPEAEEATAAEDTEVPGDPLEEFNRSIYRFNDAADRALMKPLAQGYQKVTPRLVRKGVSNFFDNLGDVTVLVNDLLQLKPHRAAVTFSRLGWNSTVGLAGLVDVATPMGLTKHDEDFGQTLGYWGVDSGPYLVLPFLGPSTVRDGSGLFVDYHTDPVRHIDDETARWSAVALRTIDRRARLLRAGRVLDEAALDPYSFLRDSYLQRRQYLIHDGNPPVEDIDDLDPLEQFERQQPGGS